MFGGDMDVQLYRWRFGTVEYDEARRELRIAGLPVEIEHKPLEVLSLLLRHAGEVVTKAELFETAWAGRVTVDNVLATAVGKLRKALDATGESRIATVPRVGYRFDGPLERMAVGAAPSSPLALEAGQPVPGRDHFLLERQLGRTLGSEVWLARHPRSRDARVFKFALDGKHLASIKREATLLRLLRESLGERDDFTRIVDWNFESAPYFLESEYGGESLADWAADGDRLARMDTAQRLAFLLPAIKAVAAAHDVGVLHKDLKPANVLVAQRGEDWQLRLTDFGSSRLLQPERLAELCITRLGMTVADAASESSSGTPLYLAPELLAGQPATTRSDVYALGVMLYQWLAGDLRRPLAPGWERDIPDPLLRDDIAQATDTDPDRRMGNADELAARLQRLPERRKERAEREAALHAAARLQESLDRTRARRPWIAATIGVLVLGLAASGYSWWRSEEQRHLAEQQATRARASMDFFDKALLTLSTGRSGYSHDPTIKDMLEYVSTHGKLSDDPKVRGDIHALLGRSWRLLGEPARSAAEYRAAIRDYSLALGKGNDLTLATRYALSRTLTYMQTAPAFEEARALLEETDRLAGPRLQQEGTLALQAAIERGIFHLNRLQFDPALDALHHADRLQRDIATDDAGRAALIRGSIGDALRRSGRPQASLAWLRTQMADPLLAPERIGTVSEALLKLAEANALSDLGRNGEALPLAKSALEASSNSLGPDDYFTITQLSDIAEIQRASGNCSASLPMARDASDRMNRRSGPDMQAALILSGKLGEQEYGCGDREAGIAHLRHAESGLRRHYGKDNPAAQGFIYALAHALAEERRYAEARDAAKELDIKALAVGDSASGWQGRLDLLRGEILIGLGDRESGRALVDKALPALTASGPEDAANVERAQRLLNSGGPATAGRAP